MDLEYADGRMPVAITQGGQVYYLAYNQVGSLRAVFDSAGNEVKRVDYDSFGNILSDSNPAFTVPFGFAGGLHDRDTGLVRFGARDYDPATGKWTAKDPIDFAGGDLNLFSYTDIVGKPSIQTNLYLYSSADPINLVDPLGLAPLPGYEYNYANWTRAGEITTTAMELRYLGHQQLGGHVNSYQRHYTASYLMTIKYDPFIADIYGLLNEVQGFLWHDLRRLRSRLSGDTPWAFSLDDIRANRAGINAALEEMRRKGACGQELDYDQYLRNMLF